MAKKVPLLCILWIVAILATSQASIEAPSATPAPSSATSPEGSSSATSASSSAASPEDSSSATSASSSAASPEGSSSTTPTPSSTASSGGPSTGLPATNATTKPPNPCEPNPCNDGSSCEPRFNQAFVCLCLLGDHYNNVTQTCEKAKVFPGKLNLAGLTYAPGMEDKTSKVFQTQSLQITNEIEVAFAGDGYSSSTVLELQKTVSNKGWLLRTNGVTASVQIIFEEHSTVTEDSFKKTMKDKVTCEACKLPGLFESIDMCMDDPCDPGSTTCTSKDGALTCTCKDGYFQSKFSERICQACPHGEKYEDSECVPCQFGYSGFNCQESWKLILVIVGSVLGALLLITIILLVVGAVKSRKGSSKKTKNEDFGKPYVSHSAAKAPLVNGGNHYAAQVNGSANGRPANVGVPRIPRATTTNSWDSRTNLEMTPSNSRQNLVPGGRNMRRHDDQDDLFQYAQSNAYAQSQSQNSNYAQNRASVNPYAQNQGHSNPYYVSDDRGRYN